MENNDPIINGAYGDLLDADAHIIQAERMIKILAEAGEDVTTQRASLATLKARREKLLTSLKQNGANTPNKY